MSDYLDQIQRNISKYSPRKYVQKYIGNKTDAQLVPYIQQAAQEQNRNKSLLSPLQTVLDLLNRGQYTTANIAAALELGKSPQEVIQAAGAGITGQQKGDWTQVLFGGQTPQGEVSGLVPWQPKTGIGKASRDAIGFLVNVLMDPTTYIGVGPAKVAKIAGQTYANDVVRLAMKQLGADPANIQKFRKGFDVNVLQDLIAKGNDKQGTRYLAKYGGVDIARTLNQTYKQARKKGTRLPAEQLTRDITPQVEAARKSLTEGVQAAYEGAPKSLKNMGDYYRKIEDAQNMFSDILDPSRYLGAGTRAARFAATELPFSRGVRYPAYVQAMDKAVNAVQESPIGGMFTKAAWAVAGPDTLIGKVKEGLGIRNPYQQLIRSVQRDVEEGTSFSVSRSVDAIKSAFRPLSKQETDAVFKAMAFSQGQEGAYKPILDQLLGPDKSIKASKAVEDLNNLTKGWLDNLQVGVDEGILSKVGDIENYMPISHQGGTFYKRVGTIRGSKAPSFSVHRQLGFEGNIAAEVQKMKITLGLDDQTATDLVMKGWGTDLNVNPQEVMVARAIAQAKAETRIEIVRKFRDMGVDVRPLTAKNPDLGPALLRGNSQIQNMGLVAVDDPSLHGFLFDRNVADVLRQAVRISSGDNTLQAFGRMLDTYTGWVKGWLTLSAGFHVRNAMSNTFTGFMQYGPRWFDPRTVFESSVATLHGLYGKDVTQKVLGGIGLSPAKISEIMNKSYAGKTLEELSNWAAQKGVISKATMGFDLPKTVEDFTSRMNNLNPLSRQFVGTKASHSIGNIVESVPRFQMFLQGVKDTAGQANPEAALDYAKNLAKKWFMDYGDLTPFEQKVMKKIIPFYSWLRKNLSNQIYGMIHMPEMYSLIPKAENMVKDQNIDPADLPDYMQMSGYLPLKPEFVPENLRNMVTTWWPNMPYGDFNKIPVKFEMTSAGVPVPVLQSPQDSLYNIISQAHPTLKALVEVSAGDTPFDVFYKSQMGETTAAPGITQLMNNKPGKTVLAFVDGILKAAGSKGLEASTDSKGRLVINSRIAVLLDNNMPVLSQLSKWLQAPEEAIPVVEQIKEEVFGAKDNVTATEKLLQVLSFDAGIKLKQVDMTKELQREMEDLMRKA